MLLRAILFMSLALLFYTYAVFSGRKEGLHRKHLLVFGLGLLCDYLGTLQMNRYALAFGKAPQMHHVTGILSLGGMAFHFLLATFASLLRRAEPINRTFHKVSLTIYTLWVIAFASGAFYGMRHMAR
ncbi:HsmA family protein [Geobacter sp. DSM 9736]|uniref:HsmA family protein n=1 Tax=Geobacter sp. DSM 9736 TaxID=1277350 RepID=UPI000B50CDF9|nr:HsmA family protein [Geobacter sp. DSM 9736]SNB44984.1 TIGR03987 family protein [Geobacter sp. DSM 9736]